jgi:hypothetical protein
MSSNSQLWHTKNRSDPRHPYNIPTKEGISFSFASTVKYVAFWWKLFPPTKLFTIVLSNTFSCLFYDCITYISLWITQNIGQRRRCKLPCIPRRDQRPCCPGKFTRKEQ